MAFDEDGKLWVVEMRDYPNGPKPGEKPQGRIKVLEDRDGDGFYETATVVADNLLFANGILPWKGGVIVTMAPQIVYIKDGKTEVLYEGFTAGNPQLRVSNPVLGLDGWVYVANGLRGGKVKKAGDPDAKAIDLSGRDFRFNLLTGQYEALSGMGQYGNCFDDWGHRFVCDNRHHLRHVVIEDRYLKRNPYLAAPAVVQDISELDKEEGPLSSGGQRLPDQQELDDLVAARGPLHGGVRRARLRRRPAAEGVPRLRLHLRADRQPRPSGSADAGRGDVSLEAAPRKVSSSWPPPTTGSGRCSSAKGRTGRCTSSICAGRSSSIPSSCRRS